MPSILRSVGYYGGLHKKPGVRKRSQRDYRFDTEIGLLRTEAQRLAALTAQPLSPQQTRHAISQ